ncbi:hypothetical protein Y032_0107g3800 [Ancylostoma ceylanicum]|uniref:Uncharacterized protein n=1 Tax=Ancylostoma ceylanicum TaxID=53326 RepID=A0A016TFG4_9BILA|nr:hypothetical protein Y032_0107g3800 [Ancylostoma ceylanicum]
MGKFEADNMFTLDNLIDACIPWSHSIFSTIGRTPSLLSSSVFEVNCSYTARRLVLLDACVSRTSSTHL